jgi:hypothetical protein
VLCALESASDQLRRRAACAKASRQPAAGRGAHMNCLAPHEISGPKSARPHGWIPSPGAEQRRGQWVVSGQSSMW